MKKLNIIVECPKKAFYNEKISEDLLKIKGVMFKLCLRKMLEAEDFNDIDRKDIISKHFSEYFALCEMEKEAEELLNVLCIKFTRLVDYFTEYGYQILAVNKEVDIVIDRINDIHNKVIIDIVYRDEGGYTVCANIHEGKINYANKVGAKSHISNDLKCYCSWLAAKTLYEPNSLKVAEIGLRQKGESSNDDFITMRKNKFKEGKNFVSYHFTNEDEQNLDSELAPALNIYWRENLIPCTEKKSKCDNCAYTHLCSYKKNETRIKKINKEETKKAPSDLLFTKAQKAFINDDKGNIRVIASAGSGKTTCIINRVVQLLKKGDSDINDLLLITFTEKGAAEMKAKLAFWLSENGINSEPDDFNVFTFNSFGNKIIQENYSEYGFTQRPTLIDSLNSMDLVKDILDKAAFKLSHLNYRNPLMNLFRARGAVPELNEVFVKMKMNNIKTLEDMDKKGIHWNVSSTEEDKLLLKLYNIYNQKMMEGNYIDYNDQLFIALNILSQNKDIAKKYSYEHILVDEAQDTSLEQFKLLDELIKNNKPKSFVVCGDDAQAIYGFRGVDMQNLIDFNKKYQDVKDYYLMDNFRSTSEIIKLADNVISLNKKNIKKKMVGYKHGDNPYILQNEAIMNSDERINFETDSLLKDIILKIEANGLAYHEMAVIGRTKSELQILAKKLNENNIPNIVAFPEYFIDSIEVLAILGLLSIMVGDADTLAIANYLQVFEPEKFKGAFDLNNTCLMEAALIKEDIMDQSDEFAKDYFFSIIKKKSNVTAVRALINLFAEKELNSLEDIYKYLQRLFKYSGDASYSTVDESADAIVLTTAHSAKGREWTYVGLLMNKMMPMHTSLRGGIFYRDIKDSDENKKNGIHVIKRELNPADEAEMEENTRLLFVAITRAKDYLTIVK